MSGVEKGEGALAGDEDGGRKARGTVVMVRCRLENEMVTQNGLLQSSV